MPRLARAIAFASFALASSVRADLRVSDGAPKRNGGSVRAGRGMSGPWRSLDDYCQKTKCELVDEGADHGKYEGGAFSPALIKMSGTRYRFAMHTGAGWFVDEAAALDFDDWYEVTGKTDGRHAYFTIQEGTSVDRCGVFGAYDDRPLRRLSCVVRDGLPSCRLRTVPPPR